MELGGTACSAHRLPQLQAVSQRSSLRPSATDLTPHSGSAANPRDLDGRFQTNGVLTLLDPAHGGSCAALVSDLPLNPVAFKQALPASARPPSAAQPGRLKCFPQPTVSPRQFSPPLGRTLRIHSALSRPLEANVVCPGALHVEYVFHVFQTTSQGAVFCSYSQYSGRIPHVFLNTYSKRGPKMDVFRINFSSLREFNM